MSEGGIRLALVPLGAVDGVTLGRLRAALVERLPLKVSLHEPLELPEAAMPHPASSDLLDLLSARQEPGGGDWTLGIAAAELSAPERPFVFGEAEVTGRCAVIGIEPLCRGVDTGAGVERVLAEAVHELGHLAGLPHCPERDCAMYPSIDIEDTDKKGADYCGCCANALANLLGRPVA